MPQNEAGAVDGRPRVVRPHRDFRLILAMDPRHGEVSRAMRNRGVELCLLPEQPDRDMMPETPPQVIVSKACRDRPSYSSPALSSAASCPKTALRPVAAAHRPMVPARIGPSAKVVLTISSHHLRL